MAATAKRTFSLPAEQSRYIVGGGAAKQLGAPGELSEAQLGPHGAVHGGHVGGGDAAEAVAQA
jgi:hypothetical protein